MWQKRAQSRSGCGSRLRVVRTRPEAGPCARACGCSVALTCSSGSSPKTGVLRRNCMCCLRRRNCPYVQHYRRTAALPRDAPRLPTRLAWLGTAWHGMGWVGTARHGTARHGTARHGTARQGTARHGKARHGMSWHGTARHGTARHAAARRPRRPSGALVKSAVDTRAVESRGRDSRQMQRAMYVAEDATCNIQRTCSPRSSSSRSAFSTESTTHAVRATACEARADYVHRTPQRRAERTGRRRIQRRCIVG